MQSNDLLPNRRVVDRPCLSGQLGQCRSVAQWKDRIALMGFGDPGACFGAREIEHLRHLAGRHAKAVVGAGGVGGSFVRQGGEGHGPAVV